MGRCGTGLKSLSIKKIQINTKRPEKDKNLKKVVVPDLPIWEGVGQVPDLPVWEGEGLVSKALAKKIQINTKRPEMDEN